VHRHNVNEEVQQKDAQPQREQRQETRDRRQSRGSRGLSKWHIGLFCYESRASIVFINLRSQRFGLPWQSYTTLWTTVGRHADRGPEYANGGEAKMDSGISAGGLQVEDGYRVRERGRIGGEGE
jgi:hypothetical protein